MIILTYRPPGAGDREVGGCIRNSPAHVFLFSCLPLLALPSSSRIFPHLPASSRIFPHLPSPPFFSFRPRPSALALFFLLCLVPLSLSPSSLTPLHSFPPPFSYPPHCAFPFLSSFLLPLPAHSSLSLLPPPHSLLLAVLYRIFEFATRDLVGKTISKQ